MGTDNVEEKKKFFEVLPMAEENEESIAEFLKKLSRPEVFVIEQRKDSFLGKLFRLVAREDVFLSKKEKRIYSKLVTDSFLNADEVLCRKIKDEKKGLEYEAIWVPESLKHEVLVAYHTSVYSAHPGELATQEAIKKRYFWIGIKRDVLQFVKACNLCAKYKYVTAKPTDYMDTSLVSEPICT